MKIYFSINYEHLLTAIPTNLFTLLTTAVYKPINSLKISDFRFIFVREISKNHKNANE